MGPAAPRREHHRVQPAAAGDQHEHTLGPGQRRQEVVVGPGRYQRVEVAETVASVDGVASTSGRNSGGTVVLEVGEGITVPSLIGMPVRAALETAEESGLELDVIGSGVAREQMPPPGSMVAPGGRISVKFAR